MSIPAVLYDFVPVDYPIEEETGNVDFFVSSMVHQVSAPLEDHDDSNKRSRQPEQSGFLKNRNGSYESTNGTSTKEDDDSEIAEYYEDDDNPMETIIDDTDSDYVLIPISSYTMSNDNDNRTISAISQKIKVYSKVLLKAVTRFSRSNVDGTRALSKTNGVVEKCLSRCTTGPLALIRKPFELYVKDLMPFSIYSYYDSASETIIDDFGNRLILPGSCVALDSDNSRSGISDDDVQNSDGNFKSGTLIFNGSESGVPFSKSRSSPSSLWSSKTIMVSAHDLLAVKHDKRMKVGDKNVRRPSYPFDTVEEEENGEIQYSRCYYNNNHYGTGYSTIMVTTTQNITQRWTRALRRLAQQKARVWYYLSQSYLRRSLRKARQLLINSQYMMIRYYKSRNGRICGPSRILYNAKLESIGDHMNYYDCNDRETEQTIEILMLVDLLGKTDKQPIEKISDGCSSTAHGSKCSWKNVEMMTLTQQSCSDYSVP